MKLILHDKFLPFVLLHEPNSSAIITVSSEDIKRK